MGKIKDIIKGKVRIRVLDEDNLSFLSNGCDFWRTMSRQHEDTIVLNKGDGKVLFYMKEGETIQESVERLSEMADWRYE